MIVDDLMRRLGIDDAFLRSELGQLGSKTLEALHGALETRDNIIARLTDLKRRAEFARDTMDNAGDVMNPAGIAACCEAIAEYVRGG